MFIFSLCVWYLLCSHFHFENSFYIFICVLFSSHSIYSDATKIMHSFLYPFNDFISSECVCFLCFLFVVVIASIRGVCKSIWRVNNTTSTIWDQILIDNNVIFVSSMELKKINKIAMRKVRVKSKRDGGEND